MAMSEKRRLPKKGGGRKERSSLLGRIRVEYEGLVDWFPALLLSSSPWRMIVYYLYYLYIYIYIFIYIYYINYIFIRLDIYYN